MTILVLAALAALLALTRFTRPDPLAWVAFTIAGGLAAHLFITEGIGWVAAGRRPAVGA